MTVRAVAALAVFAVLAIFPAAFAQPANPLDDLIAPAADSSACFARVYDDAHLRRNPRQKTTSMAVWLQYERALDVTAGMVLGLGVAVSHRGDPQPYFAQGLCELSDTVNRDTSNQRMIKEYRKEAGVGCMMSARPDVFEATSAEEGGYLILDRGRGRDTLMVYLDEYLTMVKRANRSNQLQVRFGPDDRVFLLRRTATKDCAAVDNAVNEPEPGVAPRRR
jgi:hypothetical protein